MSKSNHQVTIIFKILVKVVFWIDGKKLGTDIMIISSAQNMFQFGGCGVVSFLLITRTTEIIIIMIANQKECQDVIERNHKELTAYLIHFMKNRFADHFFFLDVTQSLYHIHQYIWKQRWNNFLVRRFIFNTTIDYVKYLGYLKR